MTESQHWGQAGRLPSSHPVAGCAQSGTQAILAQSVVSRVQIGKISKTRLGKAQKFLHCLLIFHSRVLLYIWTLNTDGQIRTHLVGSRAASSVHIRLCDLSDLLPSSLQESYEDWGSLCSWALSVISLSSWDWSVLWPRGRSYYIHP